MNKKQKQNIKDVALVVSLAILLDLCVFGYLFYENYEGSLKEKIGYSLVDKNMNVQVTKKIKNLAENLTDECEEEAWLPKIDSFYNKNIDMCRYNKVSNFIRNNITYADNTTDFPTPDTVLERGWGRCVGISVLFSSLMNSMNYTTQMVYQKGHVCVSVLFDDEMRFFYCNENKTIKYVGDPIVPNR